MPQLDLGFDELHTYLPDVPEPDDFDQFWESTISAARDMRNPTLVTPMRTILSGVDTFHVEFSGYAGEPIQGWLITPKHVPGPFPAVVQFEAYNGGRGLPHEHLTWAAAGFAHFVMDTRGQGSAWGSGGGTADPHGSGPAVPGFVTRGLASPETYYYRRLFTDAVLAVDAIRGLDMVNPDLISVTGFSQGGGTALAAGAFCDGLLAVMPDVPFMSHIGRGIQLAASGPYLEVVRYLSTHRGAERDALHTLSYFDGVAMARRATSPGRFSVGLLDDICPPSAVFAAFNHYAAATKNIDVYQFNGHEGGGGHQWPRQAEFLNEVLTNYLPAAGAASNVH